jgi:surface polysaccharide O-acyltransferase-like enzyme
MSTLSVSAPAAVAASSTREAARSAVNVPIGYLRAFVIGLVILHHTLLAYHPFAPPPNATLTAEPRLWPAFPVVDPQRSMVATVIVGFNETFFMSLMFLLSGLFAWHSIQRRGAWAFVRARALRLGVPFAVGSLLLAPLAYYPAYLQTTARATSAGFWDQWTSLGIWYSGPVWFVWVLLVLDCVAAALLTYAPRAAEAWKRVWARTSDNSLRFYATLAVCSLAVYLPMAVTFSSFAWWAYGPFTVQTSRILHYALYFLVGVALGGAGLDRGILRESGPMSRRWIIWPVVALFAFAFAAAIVIAAVSSPGATKYWEAFGSFGFVLSCAASSCAMLSLFLRFARRANAAGDSLRDNAYGIYLVHYAFVSWLLYALLSSSLGALPKAAIVTVGALGLSWLTSAALRAIPTVRRVI